MHKTEIALISGSTGFLGKHIVEAFKARDIKPISLPHSLLYLPFGGDGLDFFIQKHKPSYIVHLAGYGNHGFQQEEDKIIMANYFATWNLLQASKYHDYKAFINVSTSSIYGHKNEPMYEEMSLRPDTFYAASKASAMYLCRAYANQYNKPVSSVIPFSIYGPGEADFRFIPTICKHLITEEKMPFVAWPMHDWTYVTDFVEGVMTIIDNIDKVKGDWVNIGTGIQTENLKVARELAIIAGKPLETEGVYKEQPHHSPYWQAVNLKLMSLKWKPKIDLKAGLKLTWEYYAKKYSLKKKDS